MMYSASAVHDVHGWQAQLEHCNADRNCLLASVFGAVQGPFLAIEASVNSGQQVDRHHVAETGAKA